METKSCVTVPLPFFTTCFFHILQDVVKFTSSVYLGLVNTLFSVQLCFGQCGLT